LPSTTLQATPTIDIATKGYTDKNYLYDPSTLSDPAVLENNYPYADKFSQITWGTNLTDAGHYDAVATAQTGINGADANTNWDTIDTTAGILTVNDEHAYSPQYAQQKVSNLEKHQDEFVSSKKTITGVKWLNKYMDANGRPQDGGAVVDGKLNDTSAKAVPEGAMSNAVIEITYGDGTTDDVPVQYDIFEPAAKDQVNHIDQDTNDDHKPGVEDSTARNALTKATTDYLTAHYTNSKVYWSNDDTGTQLDTSWTKAMEDKPQDKYIVIDYKGDGTEKSYVKAQVQIDSYADEHADYSPVIEIHDMDATAWSKDKDTAASQALGKLTLSKGSDTVPTDKIVSYSWAGDTHPTLVDGTTVNNVKLTVNFAGGSSHTYTNAKVKVDQATPTTPAQNAPRYGQPTADQAKDAVTVPADWKDSNNDQVKWVVKDDQGTYHDFDGKTDGQKFKTDTDGNTNAWVKVSYKSASGADDGFEYVPVTLNVERDAEYYSDIDSVDMDMHAVDDASWPQNGFFSTYATGGKVTKVNSTSHGNIDTSMFGDVYGRVYSWNGATHPDLTGTTANAAIELNFKDNSTVNIPEDKVHITVKSAKASDTVQTVRTNNTPNVDQAKAALDLTDVDKFNPRFIGNSWYIKDDKATGGYREITKDDTSYDKADANGQITAYIQVNYVTTDSTGDGYQWVQVKLNLTPNSASYDDDPVATSFVTHVGTKAANFQDTLNKHVKVTLKQGGTTKTVDQITDPTKAKVVFVDDQGKIETNGGPALNKASDKTNYRAKIDYGDKSYSNIFNIYITVKGAEEATPYQKVVVGEQPTAAQAKDAVKVDTTNTPYYKAEWYTENNDSSAWDKTNNPFNTATINNKMPVWVKVSYYTGPDETAAEADGSEFVLVHLDVESHADAYAGANATITTHQITGDLTNATEAINIGDLDSLMVADGTTELKNKVDSIRWGSDYPILSDNPTSAKIVVHFKGDPVEVDYTYPTTQVTIKTQKVEADDSNIQKTDPSVLPSAAQAKAALKKIDTDALDKWHPVYSWASDADGTALKKTDIATPTGTTDKTEYVLIKYHTAAGDPDGQQTVKVNLTVNNFADAYKDARATITTHQVTGALTSDTEAINKSDLKLMNGTGSDATDVASQVDTVKWDSSYPTLSDNPASARIIVHFKDDPDGVDYTYPASQVTIKTQKVEADDNNVQKTDPSKLPDATQAKAALKSVDTTALKKWNPVYSWASDADGTALTTDDIDKPTGPDGKKEYVLIKYYTDQSHSESSFDGQQTVEVNLIVNNFADAYKDAQVTITTHQVTGALTSATEAIDKSDLKLMNGTGENATDVAPQVDTVKWDSSSYPTLSDNPAGAKIIVHFKDDPEGVDYTYPANQVTIKTQPVTANVTKVHTVVQTMPNNDASAAATEANAPVKALDSNDVKNISKWHPKFSWVNANGTALTKDDLKTPTGVAGKTEYVVIKYYTDDTHADTSFDGQQTVKVNLIVNDFADAYKNAAATINTHKVAGTLTSANEAINLNDLKLVNGIGDTAKDITSDVDSVEWAGTLPNLSGVNPASGEIKVHFKNDPATTYAIYDTDHVTQLTWLMLKLELKSILP